ncbi:hypothetical protein G6F42_021160 [Rhizopus arrhizus]|nr:hypothetical protein G6F42_021160 [Rhizopus arrhizus]
MQQIVAIADKTTLERIVRSFLQDTKPNKAIDHFISLLDQEMEMLVGMGDEFEDDNDNDNDDFDDAFDDEDYSGIFNDAMDAVPDTKKRARSPVLNDTTALHKRLKIPTPITTPKALNVKPVPAVLGTKPTPIDLTTPICSQYTTNKTSSPVIDQVVQRHTLGHSL